MDKPSYFCTVKGYITIHASYEISGNSWKIIVTYGIINTEITEVNLSAFVYRLFRENFSSLVGTKLSIEHSTTCDSRTNLNYMA